MRKGSGIRGQGSGSGDGSPDVPADILRRVRRIELRTRGLVHSLFGGEYESVFKGRGMEFAEVREYRAGDPVRDIDWNVTARTARPHVKKYVEERELTVMLAVDLSGSEQFGTRGRFKAELAAELAAVLALSAVGNNDRVGLLLFTDRVEHVVPPRKSRRHVLRLIRDVLAFEPDGAGTDVAGALDYAGRLLPHRSVLFLLSDFQVGASLVGAPGDRATTGGHKARPYEGAGGAGETDTEPDRTFEHALRLASRRHDLIAVRIADAAEARLPDAGLLVLTDPETGEELVVDTGDAELRSGYRERAAEERETLAGLFGRLGIDEIEVRTGESYVEPLLGFFRRRERELRR